MCEVAKVNENSRVLDPTCGSGSFLVQAMAKMIQKQKIQKIRSQIKQNQLFGIEIEEKAFGLASTNMLIHKDGKSNIICADLFKQRKWIEDQNINVVLMNPPFNGKNLPVDNISDKKGEDKTKGLYFVDFTANSIKTPKAILASILPLSAVIGTDQIIEKYKQNLLSKHTLKAVFFFFFSLPNEIFYPGASTNACIIVLELNTPHNKNFLHFLVILKMMVLLKRKI